MELIIGQKYVCEAVEIRGYGAIMKFEDGSTQLLHISNISDTFVKNIADYIAVGQSYEVTAICGKVRDVEITLRDPSNIKSNSSRRSVKTKEENFEKMLKDYLPKDEDRYRKHDFDRRPRTKKRNKAD